MIHERCSCQIHDEELDVFSNVRGDVVWTAVHWEVEGGLMMTGMKLDTWVVVWITRCSTG